MDEVGVVEVFEELVVFVLTQVGHLSLVHATESGDAKNGLDRPLLLPISIHLILQQSYRTLIRSHDQVIILLVFLVDDVDALQFFFQVSDLHFVGVFLVVDLVFE